MRILLIGAIRKCDIQLAKGVIVFEIRLLKNLALGESLIDRGIVKDSRDQELDSCRYIHICLSYRYYQYLNGTSIYLSTEH